MKLDELFRRLSFGELSGLAVGGEGVGAITDPMKPRIVNYANEALTALHSRFLLRENILMFKQVEHLTYYYMLRRYAVSQIGAIGAYEVPHSYILDSVDEPFEEDWIKLLSAVDDSGRDIPVNDSEEYTSIYTPQPNLIQVPLPVAGRVLAMSYQATHPRLDYTDDCQEIDLPFVLEPALTAFIASKVFSHMNGAENTAKGQEHMTSYEVICARVVDQDLVGTGAPTTLTKFDKRGFA